MTIEQVTALTELERDGPVRFPVRHGHRHRHVANGDCSCIRTVLHDEAIRPRYGAVQKDGTAPAARTRGRGFLRAGRDAMLALQSGGTESHVEPIGTGGPAART
jgi:hypothetical protein